MKLHQLRAFIAVLERGSVSAAARHLDFTPSTVSAHIRALEIEFGIELFERSHAGLAPTETGRSLEPFARNALEAASQFASEAAARRARIAGRLRLACSVDDGSSNLARIVARLGEAYPDIALSLSRGESANVIAQVRNQETDLGIVYGQAEAADLRADALGQAALTVAMPKAWLSASSDPLDAIGQQPWILTGDDCPFQLLSRRFFEARGIDPPALLRADDNRTRRQLVISGLGVSLLDQHEAKHSAIAVLPGVTLNCDLSLVCQAHRQFEPLIKAAREEIVNAV